MFASGMVLVSLFFILRMALIVGTTGANTVSNDDLLYMPFIQSVLAGHYNWMHFFADSFVVDSHFIAIPLLIRLVIIKATQWNVYAELWTGFAITLVKLLFMYLAFTRSLGSYSKFLLLGLLTALTFSMTQTDVFVYGDTTLELGLNQLGLALVAWSLVRFPQQMRAVVLVVLAEIVAAYSGGGGLPVVPLALLGMWMTGFRKKRQYAVWLAGSAVALAPYIYFRVLAPLPWAGIETLVPYGRNHLTHVFFAPWLILAVGFPFSPQLNATPILSALLIGIVSLGFVLRCLGAYRRAAWRQDCVPATIFLAYGVANIWITMSFRGFLQPWYTTHFMPFWIGLVGLAIVFFVRCPGNWMLRLWASGLVVSVSALVAVSNRDYGSRLVFLTTRTPASASCLRNYNLAPSYCEQYLFNWGVGHSGFLSQLAHPLQRNGLSVFSSNEEWSLQGDWALDTVWVKFPGRPQATWAEDSPKRPLPFYDFRHLNLFLQPGNVVIWTFRLPKNATGANFSTQVSDLTGSSRGSSRLQGLVRVETSKFSYNMRGRLYGTKTSHDGRTVITIPLEKLTGTTVRVRLSSIAETSGSNSYAEFRNPVVMMQTDRSGAPGPALQPPRLPSATRRDSEFVSRPDVRWYAKVPGVLLRSAGVLVIQARTKQVTVRPIKFAGVCMGGYDFVLVRARASAATWPRAVVVTFKLNGHHERLSRASASFTLQKNDKWHTYAYSVKQMNLKSVDRARSLQISLPPQINGPGLERVEISSLRLRESDNPVPCAR